MTGQFTFDDPFARLNQRITDLETLVRQVAGGPKLGLAESQLAPGTAGFEITAYGTNNWQDDAGSTTPEITMFTGSRVIIFAGFRPLQLSIPNTPPTIGVSDFRAFQVVMGVQIDSTEPQGWPDPSMRSSVSNSASFPAPIERASTLFTFREDLTPGEHTFTLRWYAEDFYPSGTLNPIMTDSALMVIPLGWQ